MVNADQDKLHIGAVKSWSTLITIHIVVLAKTRKQLLKFVENMLEVKYVRIRDEGIGWELRGLKVKYVAVTQS